MHNETSEHKNSGWSSSWKRFLGYRQRFEKFRGHRLSFGVKFLDAALGGILPDDLVLIGAPSGVGKTGFVTNLAAANVNKGRRVHVIALEAYVGEIEDRIHYSVVSKLFYKDPDRWRGNLSFRGWVDGKFDKHLKKYFNDVSLEMLKLGNMYTYYRTKNFTIEDFIKEAFRIKDDTDLIIVDHVHYFDIEDTNENRGFKEIIKKIRWVTQETGVPVVLVSHLRKRDKRNPELVAGIDEFHGSSDITKIATKIISIGKGEQIDQHTSETFIRIPKMRMDGSVTFYCARLIYDFRTGNYDDRKTNLGILTKGGTSFELLDKLRLPDWYTGADRDS